MIITKKLNEIKKILVNDGVLAYPTEAVYGIGCLPTSEVAIKKILHLKKRDTNKGFILIASNLSQLKDYIQINNKIENKINNSEFTTFIVNKSDNCPNFITGDFNSIAIRITTHPDTYKLCEYINSALISTSANLANQEPIKDEIELIKTFENKIDCIYLAKLGNYNKPSKIITTIKNEYKIIRD